MRSATGFAGKVIRSGTDEGDDFVRFLIANDGGAPVALDLTVLTPEGFDGGPDLPLWYNCAPGAVVGSGACNRVRLEFPSDIPVATSNPAGWRFRSTYRSWSGPGSITAPTSTSPSTTSRRNLRAVDDDTNRQVLQALYDALGAGDLGAVRATCPTT